MLLYDYGKEIMRGWRMHKSFPSEAVWPPLKGNHRFMPSIAPTFDGR